MSAGGVVHGAWFDGFDKDFIVIDNENTCTFHVDSPNLLVFRKVCLVKPNSPLLSTVMQGSEAGG